jgi:hypothetical protein
MDDGHDLAGIFGGGIVLGIHDELIAGAAEVLAGPVPLTTLDHHHKPAGFTRIISLRVI